MKVIHKLMLSACAIATCLAPTFANAAITRLTSYNELLAALKNGHRVSAVADNSKCKLTGGAAAKKIKANDPDLTMVIGLSFNSNFFILYRDEDLGDKRNYLATMAANTIGNTGTGAKIRYKRIRVFDDNTAELYAYISELRTGNELGGIQTTCGISNGHDQNGVSLFDYDA